MHDGETKLMRLPLISRENADLRWSFYCHSLEVAPTTQRRPRCPSPSRTTTVISDPGSPAAIVDILLATRVYSTLRSETEYDGFVVRGSHLDTVPCCCDRQARG
jgi:hypothetical protein